MQGRVLVIAGSDSGGGAGIQADIKAIMAMDAYAMTAITALTAQDTTGVHAIHPVPPEFLRAQIDCVLADLGADAIKTGMLGDAAVIDTVAAALSARPAGIKVVVDPVMVAKGGAVLLAEAAVAHLRRVLLPLADLLTPNLPEAELLCGMTIADESGMRLAAAQLRSFGVPAVLVKGGHLPGETVTDVLATAAGITVFHSPRIASRSTHGTGCTLASAIAAGLAQRLPMVEAVTRARNFVAAAIFSAPGYGRGHGPLNHGVTLDPARIAGLAQPPG